MEYKPTIGLEIHAELKTKTKMFCSSKNDPDEVHPNVNVCPTCIGHPGTLPVVNKEAIRHVLKVGIAVSGNLADLTEFDRKNYFYPDIPKGYQISQYKYPFVLGGMLSGVAITRIHLEEDTARSTHDKERDHSLLDFNRAGVPLMELVTDPVIETGEQAAQFAKELQLLLRTLGAGEANMEKGEMRVEANISVSPNKKLGSKVEVKNLNSFRSVEKAVAFEIKRQTALLKEGKQIAQETRGWDESKQETFSQRIKEESHDYRYFPDPDIPKYKLSDVAEFEEVTLRSSIPELPWEKRNRLIADFSMTEEEAELFVRNTDLERLLEAAVGKLEKEEIRRAVNYIKSDVQSHLVAGNGDIQNIKETFADLIQLVTKGKLSSRGVKELIPLLLEKGGEPEKLAEQQGLIQKSNKKEILSVVQKVVEENASVVDDYKEGNVSALQFLIGKGMQMTKGSANPQLLRELFEKELS